MHRTSSGDTTDSSVGSTGTAPRYTCPYPYRRRCMRTSLTATLVFLGFVVVFPSSASAQASITGVVKDASGAVLPGVTVEATSPELIEKARVATTDDAGRYRIVDLRAGTYAVTFSLPG